MAAGLMTRRSTPDFTATDEISTSAPGIAIPASTVARVGGSSGKYSRYTAFMAAKWRMSER